MRCHALVPALLCLLALGPALPGCLLVPDEDDCWDSSDEPIAADGSTVTVSGRASHQDGAALSGRVLLVEPPTWEDVFGAVLTLGLTCLKEDLSGFDCNDYLSLDLDGEGRFAHSLPEADTTGTLGFDKTFLLFAGSPAGADGLSRPALIAWTRFRRQHVELPELRLWEPELALMPAGGVLRVEVDEPPALACTTREALALRFTDPAGQTVWSQAGLELDRRLLEDLEGSVQASVRFENDAWESQVDTLELTSGAVAFQGSAGAPPSRGAACAVDGQPHAVDCPLTDGGLETQTSGNGQAVIDLGAARALELVVLRGSFAALTLSHSLDGQTWTELASGLAGDSLQVALSTTARHLRLQEGLDDYGQQRALQVTEVSAW